MYEWRLCALHGWIVVLRDLMVRLGMVFTVLGCKGLLLASVSCPVYIGVGGPFCIFCVIIILSS